MLHTETREKNSKRVERAPADLERIRVDVTRGGSDRGTPIEHGKDPRERDGEGDISGTVAYMSPEHTADVPLTEASDWYALGVMLYEALAGQLPFDGSAWKILADRQLRDPTPLRELWPDAPADLAHACDGLLRRDPATRLDGVGVLQLLGEAEADDATPVAPQLFVGRGAQLATLRASYRDA
jgi:serine/threonine protein kinase